METLTLTVKTVQRDVFTIHANPADTVSFTTRTFTHGALTLALRALYAFVILVQAEAIKQRIEELSAALTPGRRRPVACQRLIVKGVVVSDHSCVQEWASTPDTLVVCMMSFPRHCSDDDTDVEEGEEVREERGQKKKLQRVYKQLQCGLKSSC